MSRTAERAVPAWLPAYRRWIARVALVTLGVALLLLLAERLSKLIEAAEDVLAVLNAETVPEDLPEAPWGRERRVLRAAVDAAAR